MIWIFCSCLAVNDLIRGRQLDDVLDLLPELWHIMMKLLDDIKVIETNLPNRLDCLPWLLCLLKLYPELTTAKSKIKTIPMPKRWNLFTISCSYWNEKRKRAIEFIFLKHAISSQNQTDPINILFDRSKGHGSGCSVAVLSLPCVLSNTVHLLVQWQHTKPAQLNGKRIPRQCPHPRPKANVLATHPTLWS